jgi:hypothetical protein
MLRPRYRSGDPAGVTPATDLRSAVWSMSPRRLTSPITGKEMLASVDRSPNNPSALRSGTSTASRASRAERICTRAPSIATLASRARDHKCGTAQTGAGPQAPQRRDIRRAPAQTSGSSSASEFIDAQAAPAASRIDEARRVNV